MLTIFSEADSDKDSETELLSDASDIEVLSDVLSETLSCVLCEFEKFSLMELDSLTAELDSLAFVDTDSLMLVLTLIKLADALGSHSL